MLKKLPIALLFLMVFNMPLAAQHSHVEFTYQSLRPFVHFQLDFHSYGYNYDSYERTYLKGYMDGVNDEHYYGHNIADMLFNINAYRKGYQDGFHDRQLLIRLRGLAWYQRYRFARDDYYAPVFAVQIWLEGLSLAFIQAPIHRLPDRWQYKAHPDLKKYRKWMANRSVNVERRFKKRIHKHRKRMNKVKKRKRRAISHDRNRGDRNRYRHRPKYDTDRDRHGNRSRSVNKERSRRSRDVKKDNRRQQTREVGRKRVRETNESKRENRSRSRNRDG